MSSSISESFASDYKALTSSCGLLALPDWSTVSITGEDRVNWLQNLCTNDLRDLLSGTGCETFFTDVKGKIVVHAFLFVLQHEVLLLTVPHQGLCLVEHLDKYVIREDAVVQDVSDLFNWHVLSGASSFSVLRDLGAPFEKDPAFPWQNAASFLNGIELLTIHFDAFWPDAYLLRTPAANQQVLEELTCRTCSTQTWTSLRVESGLPLFGVDFDRSSLPQEVNRDQKAISFKKGCYLGQETVARIDALGHVNKKLVLLQFDEETVPSTGAELFDGTQSVGVVTTACWSSKHEKPLALATIRRGFNEIGSVLQSEVGQARIIQSPTS